MVEKMNKKLIVFAVIALSVLCVVFRIVVTANHEKDSQKQIQASMMPHVDVMTPFDVETSNIIEAPGRVTAVKSADVIARVQGMILSQHYKDGDFVQKGQLLYKIDPQEFQIAVESARANLESAKASQYQAQKDFERAAELVKQDFVSKSSYDQALAAKDAANASVRAASASLNDAKRLLSYTSVTAPISGKISLPEITVGNFISSPNTMLTKIVSVDPIYVTYPVDSSLYNQLVKDEIIPNSKSNTPVKVEIKLPDGTMYDKTGKMDFLDNVISQTTGTITLRATFPNPNARLIPGDFVNVKVYSNKLFTRLAVPQTAVLQDSEGRYLYVIDDKNIAHRRNIVTDGQKDDNWIISSGITKDEKFISSGVIKVRDGAAVIIKEPADNTAPKNEDAPDDAK